MSAKTTADLFRERGWGVGTRVVPPDWCDGHHAEVIAIGQKSVFIRSSRTHEEFAVNYRPESWSLYTPTPPIPTREEWAELWAKLKAFRNLSDARVHQYGHGPVLDLMLAIDAIAAKGGDA